MLSKFYGAEEWFGSPFAKIRRLRGKLLVRGWLVSPVHTYGRRGDLGLTKYSTINHWHGLSDQELEVPSRPDLCDYVFTAVDAIRPGTAPRRLRARDVA